MATETCRCPNVLYTNYWGMPPYLRLNEKDNKLEGIFSEIVKDMIHTACGICPGHREVGHTKIDIVSNGKQKSSAKRKVLEVLKDIGDVPQISFPIYGNKYITRYIADYAYINLVESPGVAFIATRRRPGSAAMNMINAVIECVPMIVLSACMAYISGFLIWTLVSNYLLPFPTRTQEDCYILTLLVVLFMFPSVFSVSLIRHNSFHANLI